MGLHKKAIADANMIKNIRKSVISNYEKTIKKTSSGICVIFKSPLIHEDIFTAIKE